MNYSLVAIALVILFDVGSAGATSNFSLDCSRLRENATIGYFRTDADLKVSRIAKVLVGYEDDELNLALIAEVLSGRITVEQFKGSVLAGLDAVDNSPVCDDNDRARAGRARSVLPSILSEIDQTIRRMNGQD
jgi:hypothetical protein